MTTRLLALSVLALCLGSCGPALVQDPVTPADETLPICDQVCVQLDKLGCPEKDGPSKGEMDEKETCEQNCSRLQSLPYGTFDAESAARATTVEAMREAGFECEK